MNNNKNNDTEYHQAMHNCLHKALKVTVLKDRTDSIIAYADVDPDLYNLYRGHGQGEGHADRLLDDYINRKEVRKAELNDKCGCTEYRNFLHTERMYGMDHLPHLSLRRRLMQNA